MKVSPNKFEAVGRKFRVKLDPMHVDVNLKEIRDNRPKLAYT